MFRKKMGVLFALSLILVFVAVWTTTAEEAPSAAAYTQAVQTLGQCLTERTRDPQKIMEVAQSFQQLGNYEYSATFYYYAKALADVEKNDYSQIANYMQLVSWNEPFQKELESLTSAGVQVASAGEWTAYLNARTAEAAGNKEAAVAAYRECLNFSDSTERVLSLSAKTQQEIAAQQAAELAAAQAALAAAAQATPVPAPTEQPQMTAPSLNASSNLQGISLSWTSAPGATQYTVYSRRTSYDSSFSQIGSTTETSYGDTGCRSGFKYTYYVQASDGQGNVVKSNEAIAVANGGEAAKNINANKNTNIVKNDNKNNNKNDNSNVNQNDSSSTSNSGAEANANNTNTNNNIITITVPLAPDKTWSAWSDWSENAVSSSATREVQTKIEEVPVYETRYNYKHWHYKNAKTGTWYNHYKEYTTTPEQGGVYGGQGSWQYKTTKEPLSAVSSVDGHTVYNGYWYLSGSEKVQTGTESKTLYRYRDQQ